MSGEEFGFADSDDGSGGDDYDYGSDGEGWGDGDDDGDGGWDDDGDGGEEEEEELSKDDQLHLNLQNWYDEGENEFSERSFERALELFQDVERTEREEIATIDGNPDLFDERRDFLAVSRIVMCQFYLKRYDALVDKYKTMLEMMNRNYVTANQRSSAINSVLGALEDAKDTSVDMVSQMYQLTLDALKKSKINTLWFNTSCRLCNIYLERGEYARFNDVLAELYRVCRKPDGTDNVPEKASALLELYAMDIELCRLTGDFARMKILYPKTKNLCSVENVETMGKLREVGGRIKMRDEDWKQAYEEFFEAFTAYDKQGDKKGAFICLKFLVVANIISNSDIDPFAPNETRVYLGSSPEIDAINDLRRAYQADDVLTFEGILNNKRNHIINDENIVEFVPYLLFTIRTRVLKKRLRPYRRVKLGFLAKEINMEVPAIESLLTQMILDGSLEGSIDQVQNVLCLAGGGGRGPGGGGEAQKMKALEGWAKALKGFSTSLNGRLQFN